MVDISPLENPAATLLEMLERRAVGNPAGLAYTFRWDDGSETSLSFGELDRLARKIAARIQQIASPGDRILLVYQPGLDFIAAFFGCVYAGMLAVPATYPKPRRPMPRLLAIVEDCHAAAALTTAQTLATLDLGRTSPALEALPWIATDNLPDNSSDWRRPNITADDLAFLQYTSGSTSEPKGVMLTHGNVLHNLEMIRQGFHIERVCEEENSGTGVFWLPAYHDMGLIGGILEPLYMGGESVLLPPASFLQRPLRWLQAISDHRAVVSGGPNFAYDLCVRKVTAEQRATLDLSCWQVAFCGAEPIRPETLRQFAETFAPCGFRPDAFYPCYGLAEATLLAAGGHGPSRPHVLRVQRSALAQHRVVRSTTDNDGHNRDLIACGQALAEQQIIIVNPETRVPCPADRVGEIWIKGPNIARGYWNRAEENEATFSATLADTGDGPFLRTGDLGFVSDGLLCVTGRVKDVIIIRGGNHYPQDIERTVEDAHPTLQAGAGAAFSIDVDGRERLVTIHEVPRHQPEAECEEILRAIRRNVAFTHELDVHAVVLIRQASLPRTTSGKVQRNLCRELYRNGELKVVAQWAKPGRSKASTTSPSGANGTTKEPAKIALPTIETPDRPLRPDEIERLAHQIETWLVNWLTQRANIRPSDLDRDRSFSEYGLDSLTAVELSQELEDSLNIQLTPIIAWNYPTLATLARYLAGRLGREESLDVPQEDATAPPDRQPTSSVNDFERLLAEIETLSDSDVETALNREPGGP